MTSKFKTEPFDRHAPPSGGNLDSYMAEVFPRLVEKFFAQRGELENGAPLSRAPTRPIATSSLKDDE
jgi:hypothetical protein